MRRKNGIGGKRAVLAVMMFLGLSTLAAAESDSARAIRASTATVPTNIPGIRTYAEPPKGFNAVTANDVELATYGFPLGPTSRPNRITMRCGTRHETRQGPLERRA